MRGTGKGAKKTTSQFLPLFRPSSRVLTTFSIYPEEGLSMWQTEL